MRWCALLLLCSGCSTLESPTARRLEYAYQAVHVVDALQTRAIDDCYHEAYPVKHLIGRQPSDGAVAAWAIGSAWGHAWMSKKLEPWPVWQRIWQMSTLTMSAGAVVRNHRLGLRVDGDNRPCN